MKLLQNFCKYISSITYKCINKQELQSFPRSLLTTCMVQKWYAAAGAGFVLGALWPILKVWLVIPWFLVQIWLLLKRNYYVPLNFFVTSLCILYWPFIYKQIPFYYILIALAIMIVVFIVYMIADKNWNSEDFPMHDKLMHYAGWGALTIYLYPIFGSSTTAILYSACSAFIFGIIYEIKDCFFADGFSVIDLSADVLGIITAVVLLLFIH